MFSNYDRNDEREEKVICLNPGDGGVVWEKEAVWMPQEETKTTPMVSGNSVLAILGEEGQGTLKSYSISLDGLTKKWTVDAPDDMRANYSLAVSGHDVFIAGETKLHRLDLESGNLVDSFIGQVRGA